MSTHEPPTLEGRTMVDLGRQLAQVRRVSAETVARLEARVAELEAAIRAHRATEQEYESALYDEGHWIAVREKVAALHALVPEPPA